MNDEIVSHNLHFAVGCRVPADCTVTENKPYLLTKITSRLFRAKSNKTGC